jgi:hypothetical protein
MHGNIRPLGFRNHAQAIRLQLRSTIRDPTLCSRKKLRAHGNFCYFEPTVQLQNRSKFNPHPNQPRVLPVA